MHADLLGSVKLFKGILLVVVSCRVLFGLYVCVDS